jgi:class 3 adenylate cyclase
MSLPLLQALPNAEGRSEFVIVVVADVRGFSESSRQHESPDIAMYIKRLYQQMMTKYFSSAKFVKPTGDGLLMTFPYSETNLHAVAKSVVESCVQCLLEFSSICQGDPMINFEVPQAMGFGIARGTACCLHSGI